MQTRTKIAAAVAIFTFAGVTAAVIKPDVYAFSSGKDAQSRTVLAKVNQNTITAFDVDPFMATGMAKPVALENAINRAVTSDAARKLWPDDAQAVAEAAAREALAALYVRKKLTELQQAVPDADISRYYDMNVKDELYSGHVLKYYLTQDAKDASDMADAIKSGNGASMLGKFSWINREGDHALLPAGVPYGLYQQVKAMQPGQYAGPFRVTDGLLFLKLEERKSGQRPELAKVKDEVRQILAQQKLEESLKELRTRAKIELK